LSSFPTAPANLACANMRCASVQAERLVRKLPPANERRRNAVEVARRKIWPFYRRLKDYKLAPTP
jgi:hypothetical protein